MWLLLSQWFSCLAQFHLRGRGWTNFSPLFNDWDDTGPPPTSTSKTLSHLGHLCGICYDIAKQYWAAWGLFFWKRSVSPSFLGVFLGCLFCFWLGFGFWLCCLGLVLEDTWLFALTYSPTCGNSQSKTIRFDDRLSLERARHELKKNTEDGLCILYWLLRGKHHYRTKIHDPMLVSKNSFCGPPYLPQPKSQLAQHQLPCRTFTHELLLANKWLFTFLFKYIQHSSTSFTFTLRTSCSGVGAFASCTFVFTCYLYILHSGVDASFTISPKALVLYTRACLLASAHWEYADGFSALLHVFDNVFMMYDIMLWLLVWGLFWCCCLVFIGPWPFFLMSLSNNDNFSTAQWLPQL